MIDNKVDFLGEYLAEVMDKLSAKATILKEEVKPYNDLTGIGKKRVIKVNYLSKNKIKIFYSYEDYC